MNPDSIESSWLAVRAAAKAGLRALTGQLPSRYEEPWRGEFESRIQALLAPGMRILDVGSGARPAVPPERRPVRCHYVGLDISLRQLHMAPPGSYDELRAGDIAVRAEDLTGQFDLALSWQVLEHVRPMAEAVENVRSYLRPGGHFVAQVSGS
ncbi:MAG TPA: class I SAM-dependent methyltransferase, partial [Dehalococcoidia bacterium]|nr:class I SAM-dependent methyltransferase [Dehalococcoidia bacterium]